jgi:hypothetical protein
LRSYLEYMREVRRVSLVCGLIALLVGVPEASAHGPCGCTGPAFEGEEGVEVEAVPGDRLIIMQPAIEIVWNPVPEDLRIDPPPELADDHVADIGSVPLARGPKPKHHVVSVPDVPDGRYLVVMYDGSEGGDHYTWDHVRVTTSQSSPSPAGSDDGPDWLWLALGAAGGLAVGLLASYLRRQASGVRSGEGRDPG